MPGREGNELRQVNADTQTKTHGRSALTAKKEKRERIKKNNFLRKKGDRKEGGGGGTEEGRKRTSSGDRADQWGRSSQKEGCRISIAEWGEKSGRPADA